MPRVHAPIASPGLATLRGRLHDAGLELTPREAAYLLVATGLPMVHHPGVCTGCGLIGVVFCGAGTPWGQAYCVDCLIVRSDRSTSFTPSTGAP